VSKEWSTSAYYKRFGVENVSKKYISIIDVKLLSYIKIEKKPVQYKKTQKSLRRLPVHHRLKNGTAHF
jgi:hypothetical protein